MSIDLYIFPTSPKYFYWGELKNKFLELSTPEDYQRLKNTALCKLDTNEIVADNNKVSILSQKNCQFYYLIQCIANTLSIGIVENEPSYLSEVDFIEDFGRNLDAATIQALIQEWQSTGIHYSVTTHAGRNKYEPAWFITLATAIAHLCKGYVIVMNDSFTLDIGIYTPTEFQSAKMSFYI